VRKILSSAVKRSGFLRLPASLRSSRGEGNAGCLFTLVLVAVAGYIGYTFVMPYYHYNAFESRIAEMVPYYRNHEPDYIRDGVMETAKEYDLALKPEQVRVQVLKRQNRIIIDVEYQHQVELPFYTHTLTFKPHLTGTAY
jgi:hypothetical protein